MISDRTRVSKGLCWLMGCALLWFLAGASAALAATVEERFERLEQKTLSSAQGAKQKTGNMVFFRSRGAWETSDRSNEVETDVFSFNGSNDGDSGYYVGAGLDLVLTRDIWDLFPGTWALGEIGVKFKRFNSKKV